MVKEPASKLPKLFEIDCISKNVCFGVLSILHLIFVGWQWLANKGYLWCCKSVEIALRGQADVQSDFLKRDVSLFPTESCQGGLTQPGRVVSSGQPVSTLTEQSSSPGISQEDFSGM